MLVFLGCSSVLQAAHLVVAQSPGYTKYLAECASNPPADDGITITSELGFLSYAEVGFTGYRYLTGELEAGVSIRVRLEHSLLATLVSWTRETRVQSLLTLSIA